MEHGIEETPCEGRLWGLRLLKDDNEQYWRARTSDVELTPHVGHTHVGLRIPANFKSAGLTAEEKITCLVDSGRVGALCLCKILCMPL